MADRRRTWIRTVLRRIGRGLLDGLTALGSCSCAGIAMSSGMRMSERPPVEVDDTEVREQTERGIAEIEAYLAAAERPPRSIEQRRRQRHHRKG